MKYIEVSILNNLTEKEISNLMPRSHACPTREHCRLQFRKTKDISSENMTQVKTIMNRDSVFTANSF